MNLVIGNTSQLSMYFPDDYVKISSRNIDFDLLKSKKWDRVYLTFAEQRIYEKNIDYITPNYLYAIDIIKSLINNSNKIICYTTCEMWGLASGKITSNTEPNFNLSNNEYTISKLLLFNKIKELRQIDSIYNNVIFVHPFYFNSIYRSNYFLFGKIFNSLINRIKINISNINFYRDMVHTKFVVEQSILANEDCVVGSGRLFNVREFIKDLYTLNDMDFEYYIAEESISPAVNQKLIMADVINNYDYKRLLSDTISDLRSKFGDDRQFNR